LRGLRREPPTEEDYRRFEALARTSRWGGRRSIGEYRRDLRGFRGDTASAEQQALIYDYFHGESSENSPGLAEWRRFGEALRAWGVPVLAYRLYMPMETGTRLFGEAFEAHVERNFSLVESSFRAGLGEAGTIVAVDPPPDDAFIEHRDGTEHLNQKGRVELARRLATAIKSQLA
jgi:hypothetical protein